MDLSWETTFTAMTVRRWRLVTEEAESCAELVSKNVVISKLYNPPWKQAREANSSDAKETAITNIEIMKGVEAAEKFITNR